MSQADAQKVQQYYEEVQQHASRMEQAIGRLLREVAKDDPHTAGMVGSMVSQALEDIHVTLASECLTEEDDY
jgi:hypothetical protein